MAGDMGMEDMVTDMDMEAMVMVIIMDTAAITMTIITTTTITGERRPMVMAWSQDHQVLLPYKYPTLLTLLPSGLLGLKDLPWLRQYSDCSVDITITTIPCTTDTATTTGDHIGSNGSTIARAPKLVAIVFPPIYS